MDERFLREAIRLAGEGLRNGRGGPFGAVVVREGVVVGRGQNQVTSEVDPTAHAEVQAIREACRTVGHFALHGCTLYTSCEPCPMCLSAIYWARIARVVFGASRDDAARAGFDDAFLYEELTREPDARTLPMERALAEEAQGPFREWAAFEGRTDY